VQPAQDDIVIGNSIKVPASSIGAVDSREGLILLLGEHKN